MPCYTVKIGNIVGIVRASGRGLPKPCIYCRKAHSFLCDYPVEIGRTPKGRRRKKDCNRALCENCTMKGNDPQYDFCREHYPLAKAAHERRLAKQNIAATSSLEERPDSAAAPATVAP